LAAIGGVPPYKWFNFETTGARGLPSTLTLNPDTGAISGTPDAEFHGVLGIEVTDSNQPSTTGPVTGSGSTAIQVVSFSIPKTGGAIASSPRHTGTPPRPFSEVAASAREPTETPWRSEASNQGIGDRAEDASVGGDGS